MLAFLGSRLTTFTVNLDTFHVHSHCLNWDPVMQNYPSQRQCWVGLEVVTRRPLQNTTKDIAHMHQYHHPFPQSDHAFLWKRLFEVYSVFMEATQGLVREAGPCMAVMKPWLHIVLVSQKPGTWTSEHVKRLHSKGTCVVGFGKAQPLFCPLFCFLQTGFCRSQLWFKGCGEAEVLADSSNHKHHSPHRFDTASTQLLSTEHPMAFSGADKCDNSASSAFSWFFSVQLIHVNTMLQ